MRLRCPRMRTTPLQKALGAWQLLRLYLLARGRTNSGYLAWRKETAFGTDPGLMPPFGERLGQMLDYGYWVHRMRRLRRTP